MSTQLESELNEVLEIEEKGETCPYPQKATPLSSWEKMTLADNQELIRVLKLLTKKFNFESLNAEVFKGNFHDIRNAAEFYRSNKFSVRPASFYRRPKELPKVCISSSVQLSQGEVFDVMFQSNFQPRYAPFREEYVNYKENQKVHARVWKHPKGKSLGTIIAVHGWFMGDQRVNALSLIPGFFFKLGLDVVLYEMPYHGRRAPETEQKFSLFPSAHLPRTNEGFAQAIYDLRSIAAWVKSESDNPVGTIGISLGGYTSALWSSLDKLDFVIAAVPLVSMADLVWKLIQEGKLNIDVTKEISFEDLKSVYSMHCPLSYAPKVEKSKRLIIASKEDPIIPNEQPTSLWQHWEEPQMHWFSGSHLGQMIENDALTVMHQFLLANSFALEKPLDIKE